MFPLYDDAPKTSTPFITYAIIAINIVVFYIQLTSPDFESFINTYAFIPHYLRILDPTTYIPIFQAMFMHGSFMHIISNLWFLKIFGDNVEDKLGHIPYLVFYLVSGVVAALAQYIMNPTSQVPMIGASGAIAGVAGAYFLLEPKARIYLIAPIVGMMTMSTATFLGYWFFTQVISAASTFGQSGGGVAFMAHIGGFVAGYMIVQVLGLRPRSREEEI